MRHQGKKLFYFIIFVLLVMLSGCTKTNTKEIRSAGYQIKSTPTLFFHGGGSSYHAETHMVDAAKKTGVTNSVIRADVSDSGKVTLIGTWKRNAKNPICKVNYQNNHQSDFEEHGIYATNVVKALQKKYKIKKINMVGHSLGNISIIYYMLLNGRNNKMPQLQKQVNIAGHFAGLDFSGVPQANKQPDNLKLDADGKPNKMNETYERMTKARIMYPKGQVAILNIIGDIGGATDGTVPNVSSLSLKYLVADHAKSYKVVTIKNEKAYHSQLHENPKVDKILIKFLWNK